MARSRSRSPSHRHRHRSRSRSREGRRRYDDRDRRRSRSRDRHRDRSPPRDNPPPSSVSSDVDKKAARLAKLQAWKQQQELGEGTQPAHAAGSVQAQAAVRAEASAAPPVPPQTHAVPQQREEEEIDPLDAFMAAEVCVGCWGRESRVVLPGICVAGLRGRDCTD